MLLLLVITNLTHESFSLNLTVFVEINVSESSTAHILFTVILSFRSNIDNVENMDKSMNVTMIGNL